MSSRPSSADIELFHEQLAENMRYLATHLRKLGASDKRFCISLCSFYEKYDRLSANQIVWAMKFWRDLQNLAAVEGESKLLSGKQIEIGTEKVLALLEKAKTSGLLDPKIKTSTFTVCYSKRNIGNILFRQDYDTLAEIGSDDKLRWKPAASIDERAKIKSFCEDPICYSIREGKSEVRCCFCSISLTTKESRSAGYGPICAGKWGLPWGDDGTVDSFMKGETL